MRVSKQKGRQRKLRRLRHLENSTARAPSARFGAAATRDPSKKRRQPLVSPPRARPKYNVSELVAQCDPNAPVPEDIQAWMDMPPVGKEIW